MTLLSQLGRLLDAETVSAQSVARELRLRFDGEQHWPGNDPQWAFTCIDRPRNDPRLGITFYVPVGSSRDHITRRWAQKQRECLEGATPPASLQQTTTGANINRQTTMAKHWKQTELDRCACGRKPGIDMSHSGEFTLFKVV